MWSPEGIESGFRWHVNPGGVSDPQGGEEKAQNETTREGGRQGLRVLGVGSGRVCVCRNPVYKFSDSVGLTDASGVCLAPGSITVALRCSRL